MLHVLGKKYLQNLFGNLKEKEPGHKYDGNNEMCIKELYCDNMD
jgi:hypothetical protein